MQVIDLIPATITSAFLLSLAAGVWVAYRYGPLRAYIGFVWLIPLAATFWLIWGDDLLGVGNLGLNLPFVLGTVFLSFIVGIICFPFVIYLNRKRLTAIQILGVASCALLYAFPFLFFFAFSLAVQIWGK